MTDQKKLLSHEDVCTWLKISRQTLWVWRKDRGFPTALWDTSARGLRWRRADVDAWLEENGEDNIRSRSSRSSIAKIRARMARRLVDEYVDAWLEENVDAWLEENGEDNISSIVAGARLETWR